ncbi:MAG: hypothetical protein AAGA21_16400 [Pseudomonadota bacterium]
MDSHLRPTSASSKSSSWFPSGYADRKAALDWAGIDLFGLDRWSSFQTTKAKRVVRWSPSLGGRGKGRRGGEKYVPISPRQLYREHFEAAEHHLRTRCEDDTIRVFELSPLGDRAYSRTVWRSDKNALMLRRGRSANGHHLGFILPAESETNTASDPKTIERQEGAREKSVDESEADQASTEKKKLRRGRKPQPFWLEIDEALYQKVRDDGIPQDGDGGKAELAKFAAEEAAELGEYPDAGTCYRHVSAAIERREKELAQIKG